MDPSTQDASAHRAARLETLFKDVDLPEITGVDFGTMSHADVAQLLPPFGGTHPMKAFLLDVRTGKVYGIASGWDAETVTHNGMPFKAGAISEAVAVEAGGAWSSHGNHVEPVAAAFMRKMDVTEAVVYINGRDPCWGTPDGTGCYYQLPTFLAEGATMTVYNKYGSDFLGSRQDRRFNFRGLPD